MWLVLWLVLLLGVGFVVFVAVVAVFAVGAVAVVVVPCGVSKMRLRAGVQAPQVRYF